MPALIPWRASRRVVLAAMAGRRRMAQGRLDVAQARGERDRRRTAPGSTTRPGPACPGRSSGSCRRRPRGAVGQAEVGVRREQRVVHARDAGMRPRAGGRGPAPSAQARPIRRLRVERPRIASQLSNGLPVWPSVEATRPSARSTPTVADQRPERQVAVAADHLRHRVHDQARAVLDRPADQRGERVVDDQGDAGLPGDRGQAGEVRDAEQGIGEGLGEDRARRSGSTALGRRRHRPGRRCVADPPSRQLAGDQGAGPAVDAVGDQHMVALAEEREQRRGDGPHARGADQARPRRPRAGRASRRAGPRWDGRRGRR